MPFMILYGGELVFAFLGARILRWMWRSREQVLALWRERHGASPSGPSFEPDPLAQRGASPKLLRAAPSSLSRVRDEEQAPVRRAA
jgi:hypothetical protein